MSIVTVVPQARRQLFGFLADAFIDDPAVQVIVGLPLSEDYQLPQVVSLGATQPADTDVDWESIGAYRKQERFSLEVQVQLHLADEFDQLVAEDRLGEVLTTCYVAANRPTHDLGLKALLGIPHCVATVTGSDPRTVPLPTGGFLCESVVRVSVEARVNSR